MVARDLIPTYIWKKGKKSTCLHSIEKEGGNEAQGICKRLRKKGGGRGRLFHTKGALIQREKKKTTAISSSHLGGKKLYPPTRKGNRMSEEERRKQKCF